MSLIHLLILVSLLSPSAWRATTDEGVGLDPHGGCRPTNALDAGVIIDPNG